VITQTAVEVLVDRLPGMMLAVRPKELTWRTSFQVRGLTAPPMKSSPASSAG
jgi:hypothetical protein